MDGGTAQLHALLAGAAGVGIHLDGGLCLHGLEQDAGAAGNNDAGALGSQLLGDGLLTGGQIVGIHHRDAVNAHGAAEGLQIHLGGGVAVDVVARGGVLLVTRHTRDGVVQDDDRRVRGVIRNIHETRHARMHEGGVTDDGHGALFGLGTADLVKSMDTRHRRAHAQHRVNGVEGLSHAQGVAADVTDDGDLVLGEGVEQASVGASCAHDGRTDGDGLLGGDTLLDLHAEDAADEVLGELALHGEEVLAVHRKTQGLAVVLNDGIQLLNDHHAIHLGSEVGNELLG